MITSEIIEKLVKELNNAQYRKSVGLLSPDLVKRFVEIVQKINNAINLSGESGMYIQKASMQPKTSEGNYCSTNQKYRGPVSIAAYENNEYKIIRCEGDFDYYSLHQPGILLHLYSNNSGRIGAVLKLFKDYIDWQRFKVEELTEEGLTFFIFIPMDI